jgi:hypothetical protein
VKSVVAYPHSCTAITRGSSDTHRYLHGGASLARKVVVEVEVEVEGGGKYGEGGPLTSLIRLTTVIKDPQFFSPLSPRSPYY